MTTIKSRKPLGDEPLKDPHPEYPEYEKEYVEELQEDEKRNEDQLKSE